MYPHERSLVKKLADKPFVLVGINSDTDRDRLKERIKEEKMTWRSWWDGGSTNGPIASSWNVEGWPTLYILDHKGTIRHKFLGFPGGQKFDDAVEALLKEAEEATEH
jgi:Thioredoxin-like